MPTATRPLVAIDLGGTKMLTTLVQPDFSISARLKQGIPGAGEGEATFEAMVESIRTILSNNNLDVDDISGIAFGVPGLVKAASGVIMNTPNLGFTDFPLQRRVSRLFKTPVLVENDVNAGTYGEFRRGSASGFKHIIGVFPGTGLGGGLVLDGRLYRGAMGGAGELGHMIIQVDGRRCGCGQFGCIEAMSSRTAISKELAMLAAIGKAPTILAEAGTDVKKIKSKTIKSALQAGDEAVADVVNRSARFLGIAMANLVNIFNPEAIVMGGGLVEKLGEPYIRKVKASMQQHAMHHLVESVKVVKAALGDDAVAIGAAALLYEQLDASR